VDVVVVVEEEEEVIPSAVVEFVSVTSSTEVVV
jgi:hypothetical protein